MMMSQYVCLAVLVSALVVTAYPDGAPLEVCGSMFPTGHHVDAMTSASPYSVTVDKTSFNDSDTITVSVTGTTVYEGLFVQARLVSDCSNTAPIGTFALDAGEAFLKFRSCGGVANSAVTHVNATKSTSRRFIWQVPNTVKGHIYFRATVVKTEKEFWTNVFSVVIRDLRLNTTVPNVVTCPAQMTSASPTTTGLPSIILVAVFTCLASFKF